MGFAIENFLSQYEKGLGQLSTSPTIVGLQDPGADKDTDSSEASTV